MLSVKLITNFFIAFTTVASKTSLILSKAIENGSCLCGRLNYILAMPSTFNQIVERANKVKELQGATSEKYNIRLVNFRCLIILDVLVGLVVMVTLLRGSLCEGISEVTLSWADTVVLLLNRLLNWLLGVPAGLKLNSPLNQFLGRFFHYHIYLWTGYLGLLKPALVYLIRGAAVIGVLGFTHQLCLLQDIFSTLTLHIYCFYVYATRLYYFQVYALSSLWRLFRGRKWNVLRCRVDLASYDVDQLFVGTILFTILLFLLPTTALYYFVFLTLRLMVLLVNGVVAKVVCSVNRFPMYALLLRLAASDSTVGLVYYEVLEDSTVTMKTSQMSYTEVYRRYTTPGPATPTCYTWGDFIKKVVLGELIYPWNGDAYRKDTR